MRSPSPTKYAYGDEHYRIKFKDSTVESPCSLDNIIVHKGFSLNFELLLNENVDCRWCCSKQEQKQGKKQNKTKQTTNARLITTRQLKWVKITTREHPKDFRKRIPKAKATCPHEHHNLCQMKRK